MTALSIPYSKIEIGNEELELVSKVLASGWLTTGPVAQELEKEFAKAVGARYACAVSSCTSALHLAAEALRIGPGVKVFVPTWTFTASAEILRYLGADPVLLDVEVGSCLLTPSILQAAIQRHPDVRHLIIVHFGGQAAQMSSSKLQTGISQLCKEHNIKIIHDAAHAFPAKENGHMVGSMEDITCFSFYANKTMTTGEGGMLTTNDEDVFNRCKLMRLHGINRDVWKRFTTSPTSWEYDVVAPGYKYNMPDLNAAVGLAQLKRAGRARQERQRCAEHYLNVFSGCTRLELPKIRVNHSEHAWHIFPILLKNGTLDYRNKAITFLATAGIGTSVHYKPLHKMTYYKERYRLCSSEFPNSERMWASCLSLPIYSLLTTRDLDYICNQVFLCANQPE